MQRDAVIFGAASISSESLRKNSASKSRDIKKRPRHPIKGIGYYRIKSKSA
jgi:hypothetical protein